MKKFVTAKLSVYGYHQWDGAPAGRVYLGYPHRHEFIITAAHPVIGSNREIEFHDLKDRIKGAILKHRMKNENYNFGGMSCEMIGEEILKEIPELISVEVSEDGECSSILVNDGINLSPEAEEYSGERPYVVTLCGSTKFREEFEMASSLLEDLGIVTLSVGAFMHAQEFVRPVSLKSKESYDELHKQKIRMSDAILVLNRDKYIGDSTGSEILYAHDHNKEIYFLEGDSVSAPDRFNPQRVINGLNVIYLHEKAGEYAEYWSGKKRLPFIIRQSVYEFSIAMEQKLTKKDAKGGWQKNSISNLFSMMNDEVEELKEAINSDIKEEIRKEAVDVADFSMMIFDNMGRKEKSYGIDTVGR